MYIVVQLNLSKYTKKGKLNINKIRHDYLIQVPGKPLGGYQSQPICYLSPPYPDPVMEMISSIPTGFQGLALQDHGMCLDMIAYLAGTAGWADQVRSNALASSKAFDDTPSPLYSKLGELWRILKRLDAQSAPLERSICIAHYIQLLSMIYRRIVRNSPVFEDLRAEATEIIHTYQPRTFAERENLIFHSMCIVDTWKTGIKLDPEGVRLLCGMMRRFPEVRRWETLIITLQKFPWTPQVRAEWEGNLRQSLNRDL